MNREKLDDLKKSLTSLKGLLRSKKHVVVIVGLTVIFGIYRISGSSGAPKGPSEQELEAKIAEDLAVQTDQESGATVRRSNVSGSNINTDLLGDMLKSPEDDADNSSKTARSKKPRSLIGTSAGLADVEKSLGLR